MSYRYSCQNLFISLAVALSFSSCGGGGGGSVAGLPSPSLPGDPGGRNSLGLDTAQVRTARAIPNKSSGSGGGGSVTQSSDVDGGTNITRDTVSVTIAGDSSDMTVTVTYNDQRVVDTATATATTDVEELRDERKGSEYFERVGDGVEFNGIEFYRALGSDDLDEADGSDVPAGDLWVDVYTDFGITATVEGVASARDATNYLAGGIWVYILDVGGPDDYEFGAFGSGVALAGVAANLTGTATYSGGATGTYSHPVAGGRRNEFFDADVALTADFGDASANGMIEGTVSNFTVERGGTPVDLGLSDLNLEAADIDNTGFFTGDTSTDEGNNGEWGGGFFNDKAAVGGTFGASSNDNEVIIGVFGAYRR